MAGRRPCLKDTCVGLARTIYIYGVHTVFLAGEAPNIRSYTVYTYGSGHPYTCACMVAYSLQGALIRPKCSPRSEEKLHRGTVYLLNAIPPYLRDVGAPTNLYVHIQGLDPLLLDAGPPHTACFP